MSSRKNTLNSFKQGFSSQVFLPHKKNSKAERFELLKSMAKKHKADRFIVLLNQSDRQSNTVFGYVLFLANRAGIEPKLTGVDRMAHSFTRLAGEPAKSDSFDDYVVALSRHKVLDPTDVVKLTAAHMAESAK